jgi:hypothetical protein
MEAKNTLEEALVGRTVKLSVIDCLIMAELINDLTGDMKQDRTFHRCKVTDLNNLSNLFMKMTGQDIISIDQARNDLFAPVDEELRYNTEGKVITSSVEAYEPSKHGNRSVGKIQLKPLDSSDINEIS